MRRNYTCARYCVSRFLHMDRTVHRDDHCTYQALPCIGILVSSSIRVGPFESNKNHLNLLIRLSLPSV